MKQNLFVILFILLEIISTYSFGQNKVSPPSPCDDPLPSMFVPKDSALKNAKEFSQNRFLHKSKYSRIKTLCKIQDAPYAFIYNWDAINDLLNNKLQGIWVRLYFAMYTPTSNANFPGIEDSSIVLLFTNNDKDPSEYYLITKGNAVNVILKDDGNKWRDIFEKVIQKELKKSINKGDSDNYFNKEFSDTKSIIYCRQDMIEAFIDEKNHQMTHHNIDLAAFGVQLASYTRKGRAVTTENKLKYKKRLYVQFQYLQKINGTFVPFYLDDQKDDYECRKLRRKPSNCPPNKYGALDNGHLCPTDCPI